MKIYLNLLLMFCFLVSINGQDIKIKKDILYLDEVPTLKVVGKCGVFTRLNYTFMTLEGDTLFTMIDRELRYNDPRNPMLMWHELDFNGLIITLPKSLTYVTDKQAVSMLLSYKPVFIKDGNIDQTLLSEFATANDFTPGIVADSTNWREFERKQKEQLDATTWNRDKSKEIVIRSVPNNKHSLTGFSGYSLYEVYQDNVFLGVIVQKTIQTQQSKTVNYYFLKRLKTPFEHDGKTHHFGMIAYVEGSRILIVISKEGDRGYAPRPDSTYPLMDYTKYLLGAGCLD